MTSSAYRRLGFGFRLGRNGVLWQWRGAVTARTQTEAERYDADIALAQILIEQQRFDRAQQILGRKELGRAAAGNGAGCNGSATSIS